MPLYGQIDADYSKQLRSTLPDGPIYMLGLEKFRPDIERGTVRAVPRRDAGLSTLRSRYSPLPERRCALPPKWSLALAVGIVLQ